VPRPDRHVVRSAARAIVAVVACAILDDFRADEVGPALHDRINRAEKLPRTFVDAFGHDYRAFSIPLIAILGRVTGLGCFPDTAAAREPLLLRGADAHQSRHFVATPARPRAAVVSVAAFPGRAGRGSSAAALLVSATLRVPCGTSACAGSGVTSSVRSAGPRTRNLELTVAN
jgi:hypothetical protein